MFSIQRLTISNRHNCPYCCHLHSERSIMHPLRASAASVHPRRAPIHAGISTALSDENGDDKQRRRANVPVAGAFARDRSPGRAAKAALPRAGDGPPASASPAAVAAPRHSQRGFGWWGNCWLCIARLLRARGARPWALVGHSWVAVATVAGVTVMSIAVARGRAHARPCSRLLRSYADTAARAVGACFIVAPTRR